MRNDIDELFRNVHAFDDGMTTAIFETECEYIYMMCGHNLFDPFPLCGVKTSSNQLYIAQLLVSTSFLARRFKTMNIAKKMT